MEMNKALIENTSSLKNRQVYTSIIGPAPAYFMYLIPEKHLLSSIQVIKYISCFVSIMGILWIYINVCPLYINYSYIVLSAFILPLYFSDISSGNLMFTGSFLALYFFGFRRKSGVFTSILLGLLIVTDRSTFILLVLEPIYVLIKNYKEYINPSRPISNTNFNMLISICRIACALLIGFGIFCIDLLIRNSYCGIQNYSLEFLSSLKGFTKKHLADDPYDIFGTGETRTSMSVEKEKNYRYVMDRGFLSFESKHHMEFIDSEGREFEIEKLHTNVQNIEEERFVRNEDMVRIRKVSGEYLGLEVPQNSENIKIFSAGFGKNYKDGDDEWIVKAEGPYLLNMETPFRLLHRKHRIFLGAKKVDGSLVLDGSVYTAKQSHVFYVVGNRQHRYYTQNFNDPRVKERTHGFPQKSFPKRLMEIFSRYIAGRENQRGGLAVLIMNVLVAFWASLILFRAERFKEDLYVFFVYIVAFLGHLLFLVDKDFLNILMYLCIVSASTLHFVRAIIVSSSMESSK